MNTPNPNPSPELREERTAWLRDRLLYAIQFHMWSDATAAEVEEVIESLSDSDEYDPNVAALVQMPKWCSPCEAQQGVDSFFASPQTLPAPGEVEADLLETLLGAAKEDVIDSARMQSCSFRASHILFGAACIKHALATVAAANDEGVAEAFACGVEAAAKVADAEERAADAEIASYDSYGGPPLPARAAEAQRRGAARSIAAAIRLLSQGGGK